MEQSTLWMGDLEPWMDETFVKNLWYQYGESPIVKMIRDKQTGNPAGYCFLDFPNAFSAAKHLQSLNGTLIPGTTRVFKLNWASGNATTAALTAQQERDMSVFVGDLGQDVTDYLLYDVFRNRYMSVKSAKIVTDPITGHSKGFGFVRFGDESEQQRAMVEMQGLFLGSRPIRVAAASGKGKLMAQPSSTTVIPTPTPSAPAAAVPPPPVIQRMKYPNEPVSVQEANQHYLQVQSYMMEHGNILVSEN